MLAVSLMAMLALSAVPALADDGGDRWDDRWDDRQEELFFFDGFFFDGFFFEDDFDGFFFDDDEDFDRFDFDGELDQDVEQDAESGDLDQSFDVSQTGDNSNQCVGVQGVANTGNAQNQIGVIDAGDFNGNDFNNGNDFCEDFDGNDFCEDLEEFCDDFDGNGICDFFFDDGRDRFDDGFFFGDDDDGGFEFDNVGSTIEVSPINTTSSNQQVNQAASASGS
jgi:hypothetical protein